MYTTYFGLREKPFNVTPDPRFFYANPVYHEAYASLLAGIQERKGFVVMTGEVGTGKTTLLRMLMKNVEATVRFAYLYNTTLTFEELLAYTCDELGIQVEGEGRLKRIQALNAFLIEQLRRGGTGVLLIDEAQNLAVDVLENLRLLSNLETSTEKLLQIVLVGQPELQAKLAQPALRQLRQRVSVQCRLDRLKDREVESYIRFRLETAGARKTDLFDHGAVDRIAFYSKGIPRLINILCDNALLVAYAGSARSASAAMVEEVASDLGLQEVSAAKEVSTPPGSLASDLAPADATVVPTARRLSALQRRGLRRPSRWRRFAWARFGIFGAFLAVAGGTLLYAPSVAGQIAGMKTSIRSAVELLSERAALAWTRATPIPAMPGVSAATTPRPGNEPAVPPTAPTKPEEQALPDLPERRQTEPRRSAELPAVNADRAAPAQKPRSIVIPQGATIAGIAFQTYGGYNVLAIDLIKESNPHIADLNWIRAGERLWLPALDAGTLIRKQPDGTYRLVAASFLSSQAAEKTKERMRKEGYEASITLRKLSDSLQVHRVELTGLGTQDAARQAWDTASAKCWLLIADPLCERKNHG